jgi:hypothetical protein
VGEVVKVRDEGVIGSGRVEATQRVTLAVKHPALRDKRNSPTRIVIERVFYIKGSGITG